jgi:DNA ligase (NAD+)
MEGKQLEIRFNEIEALEAEIENHQDLYQQGRAIISDREYDEMVRRLEAVNPDADVLSRIGAATGEVEHVTPMLSLQKAYSFADVDCWWACDTAGLDDDIMVSMKLDGIACSLVYEGGKLILASTRGDGLKGQDITRYVTASRFIPQTVPSAERIEIRGELVIAFSDYAKHGVKKGRTSVASAMRGKVKPICEALRFVAYDAVNALDEGPKFANLGLLGFEVALHTLVSWNAVEAALEAFTDARASYAYDCDGFVLKLAKKAHQIALGCTRHHPRAAIAYKFDTEGF